MKYQLSILFLFCFSISNIALGENKPALGCEIFIKNVNRGLSYHGSHSINTTIQIGAFPEDEIVQKVGFYHKSESIDLGNSLSCNNTYKPQDWFSITGYPIINTSNQYSFNFMVNTVSVTSECRGYNIKHIGAFFVETNKNTYWLNPDMTAGNNFQFDLFSHGELYTKGDGSTAREDMKYYNPAQCK